MDSRSAVWALRVMAWTKCFDFEDGFFRVPDEFQKTMARRRQEQCR